MKALASFLLIISLFACKGKQYTPNSTVYYHPEAQISHDTVMVVHDSLIYLPATNEPKNSHICDSLKTALVLSQYSLQKVKFYMILVKKNPSQLKFLMGWLNRAVN